LLFKEQRYKIESNSQQWRADKTPLPRCCSKSKDTKLKAIHNLVLAVRDMASVVVQRAKIQNWKQFTTNLIVSIILELLLFKEQRYKIESNSQPSRAFTSHWRSCCSKSKDTKLKAIHNKDDNALHTCVVVVQRAKIQNWKQFTTGRSFSITPEELLFKEQRYKIESNSQQATATVSQH